eukprot:7548480-Heterocapsa_arctica.AAC.1
MPGERQAVSCALEVRAAALAVMNARLGRCERLQIIPELLARPARDVHLGSKLATRRAGHVEASVETPAGRGRRAH